jgi:hydroxyacylglutathione hydrolase
LRKAVFLDLRAPIAVSSEQTADLTKFRPFHRVQSVTDLAIRAVQIVSVPFEENAYVVSLPGRDDCFVVDPGLEPQKIIQYLEKEKLAPVAILNTHGHGDHIGGNAALKRRWPAARLVIGADEAAKLTDAELNLSAAFGMSIVSPPADVLVRDGETFSAAGLDLEVRAIPGHSLGHVVYLAKGCDPMHVFVGDVIFAGSIGRSDFPDGDFSQLAAGIRTKLYTLPDPTVLLPGHGPSTTVGREKRTNPFVFGQ